MELYIVITSLTENSTNIFFKLISNKGNSFILFWGNSINKFSTIFSKGTSGNFSLKTSAKVLILLNDIETFLSFFIF